MDMAAPPIERAADDTPSAGEEGRACDATDALRPKVNTFDVFDTLIARRCVDPLAIFDMVERLSGRPGFAEARRRAEASVAHAPYDLPAIYAALSAALDLTVEEAEALRLMEVAIEHENVVPIAENIAAVSDGDVLISDMYLGADIIRSLLDRAGFKPSVGLVVTSNGKHAGWIWPQMAARVEIVEHLGDNLHSDILTPQRHGIRGRHTTLHAPDAVETVLLDIGLRDLATACREARLASWSPDPGHRALQRLQCSRNVPILLLGSLALIRMMRATGCRRALFSSRDCNLWVPMFDLVRDASGFDGEARYFYTSRLARTRPSPDYLAYARKECTEDAVVVDVCGTGWSLAHLFEALDRPEGRMFFLHHLPAVASYERRAPTPPGAALHALLSGTERRWQNMALEMCNYAEHGMVVDVRRIAGADVPIFAPDERSDATLDLIRAQRACFRQALAIVARNGLRECLTLDDAAIAMLCGALYEGLSGQQALYALYARQHLAEDQRVMHSLGAI